MMNVLAVFANNLDQPQGFDHSIYLDSEDKYKVFWKFDEESITFEVSGYKTDDLAITLKLVFSNLREHISPKSFQDPCPGLMFGCSDAYDGVAAQTFLLAVIFSVYCKGIPCVFTQIHVETLGYVGFGLSSEGKMENSDVIIFLVDLDGNAEFTVSTQIRLYKFSV